MAAIRRRKDAGGTAIFSYTQGTSFLHRAPAGLKIVLMCLATVIIFSLQWAGAAAVLCALAVIVGVCGFSPAKFFAEQRGLLWYGLFLAVVSLPGYPAAETGGYEIPLASFCSLYPERALPAALFTLRIIAAASAAALVFKTTTTSAIRRSLESAEERTARVLRLKKKTHFSLSFALLLTFIPTVFETWNKLDRSWRARGGRQGIRKVAVLIPALVSVLMARGSDTGTAIRARNIRE